MRYYYVTGEVMNPGPQPYLREVKLTEAIDFARGFTTAADRRHLELRHRDGSIERYDYLRITQLPTNNPSLRPGDELNVRRK